MRSVRTRDNPTLKRFARLESLSPKTIIIC